MSIFTKLPPGIPVDRVAARVTRPGVHFSFPDIEVCRGIAPFPITHEKLPAKDFYGVFIEDLTGRSIGRLKVVGRFNDIKWKPGKKVRWVVRCACGYYEIHRTRALRNIEMCSHCDLLEQRKKGFGPWSRNSDNRG